MSKLSIRFLFWLLFGMAFLFSIAGGVFWWQKSHKEQPIISSANQQLDRQITVDQGVKLPIEEGAAPFPQNITTSKEQEFLPAIKKMLLYYDVLKDSSPLSYIYNFYIADLENFSVQKIYSDNTQIFNNERIKRYGKDKIITNLFAKDEFAFDIIAFSGKKERKSYSLDRSEFENSIFSQDASLIAAGFSNYKEGGGGIKILNNTGQVVERLTTDFYKPLPDTVTPLFFSSDAKFLYGLVGADTGTEVCFHTLFRVDLDSLNIQKGPEFSGCVGHAIKYYNEAGIVVLEYGLSDEWGFPEEVPPTKVSILDLKSFEKRELFISKELLIYDALLSPNGSKLAYVTQNDITIFNVKEQSRKDVVSANGARIFGWIDEDNLIYYTNPTHHSADEYHLFDINTKTDNKLVFLKLESFPIK